jgi:2-methylisocitrate lyase-like PEP mutase family enzyme
MRKSSILRSLIAEDKIIVAPGIYDCVSAKIVENLGFETAVITGYGLEASVLGNPDIGLATKTDVITHARYISRSVEIPVICDSDTGYGNVLNVWETVREFEQAGVAGIHIEDQALPKKCGGMLGRTLISVEEMQGKIEAATDARNDKDFIIIARSDARSVFGVDEAIRRYNAYFDAGADMALVAERYEIEELEKVATSIRGPLCFAAGVPGWDETILAAEEYRNIGVKLVAFPLSGLFGAARALFNIYGGLKANGGIFESVDGSKMVGFDEFNELIGLPYWTGIEKKYLKS